MPFWQLHYHFVWTTKHRQPLLTEQVEPVVYDYLREKSAELDVKIFALNGVADHVHLVAAVPPKLAVAKFVGQIKGYSSTLFNQRSDAPFRFQWQTEYAAFSFDRKRLPNYISYVRRQKEHHQTDTTIPILERTEPILAVKEDELIYATESADWRENLIALGKFYNL